MFFLPISAWSSKKRARRKKRFLRDVSTSLFTKKACRSQYDQIRRFFTLGNNSKPVATIILPKLHSLLGNFCKGVKIIHFSSEIILGQLLKTFGNFIWPLSLATRGHYIRMQSNLYKQNSSFIISG